MEIEKLKAMAYDLLVQRQQIDARLQQVDNAIKQELMKSKELKEQPKKKAK